MFSLPSCLIPASASVALVAGAPVVWAGGDLSLAQRELQADAASRTSFQGDGAGGSGGGVYGPLGFTIGDASGGNTLGVGGSLQFRYNASFRDESPARDDTATGFSTQLTRVRVNGTLAGTLDYRVRLFAGTAGTPIVEEAFASAALAEGWRVTWGQFTLPTIRENILDSEATQGAGFSTVSEYFNQGFSQGVMVAYEAQRWRAFAAWSDGLATINTDFLAGDATTEADYALSVRAEGLLLDQPEAGFARFADATSFRDSAPDQVLLGAALHWQDGGSTGSTLDRSTLQYTIDVAWKTPGVSVGAALVGQHIDSAGADSRDDFGATLQAGVFLTEQVELFARYDALFIDEAALGPAGDVPDPLSTVTLGANYFPLAGSSAAKLTVQAAWMTDGVAGLETSPTGGLIAGSGSSNGLLGESSEGEVAVVMQFQIVF